MTSFLHLVIRNISHNRRRSALTVASVAVSLGLLGVLLALYRCLFFGADTTPGQAQRLIVHHKIALTQELPVAYEPEIARIPGVRAVTRLRWFGGVYKDARDPKNRFAQFAVEPQTLFAVYPEYAITERDKQAFISQKTACVASRELAEKLGWKQGDRITLVGALLPADLELTLVGIFEAPASNSVLYFNWAYLHDSLPAGDEHRDMIQQFHVGAAGKDVVSDVSRRIDALFADSPFPTTSEPEQAFMLSFVSFLGNLKLFLAVICAAVTFTILLISANLLSMSVRERTREVGILKTLGFSPGEILGMVAAEGSLIALAGGLLGCGLAGSLCAAMGAAMRNGQGFVSVIKELSLSPSIAALTLAIALLIGLASSLLPGLSASRSSIVDALHFNG